MESIACVDPAIGPPHDGDPIDPGPVAVAAELDRSKSDTVSCPIAFCTAASGLFADGWTKEETGSAAGSWPAAPCCEAACAAFRRVLNLSPLRIGSIQFRACRTAPPVIRLAGEELAALTCKNAS